MEIPVVFATDENYLFYTVVAISSMAENAGEQTFYRIYILVSGELEKGHRLLGDVQEKYNNIEIRLLPVNKCAFQNVHINNSHVSKATFYRLLLGDLLQADKCLYLDSDIIVNVDLQELYDTEMGAEYIAGVRDLWLDLLDDHDREQRRIRTDIPSLDQYVNAGVLLLNLDKIRKDNLTEKFCKHMRNDYPYEDQDIVNVCCYGHIRRLPAKWNLFTLFIGKSDELREKGIDEETIFYMEKRKGIIHYATPFIRPWESERFLCNDIWWKYAAVWSETAEYQRIREKMSRREIGYSIKAIADYCAGYEAVYIWGFTELGRGVFDELLQRGVDNIIGFIDNDAVKQKFTYCGKPVCPFDMEICKAGKRAFIIVSRKREKEIQGILANHGVPEEDMVCYIQKSPYYYQCLRPEFSKEENRGERL